MIVGLTGGIGSGKTTIVKMFEALGVPVYISDIEAKRLMCTSKAVKNKLIVLLGDEAYIKGELNKTYISDKIFSDTSLLNKVNAIVHPSVRRSFKIWAAKQKSTYVIQESAILFENGMHHNFDKTILITAPLKDRIERVVKRDNTTAEAVQKRINNQWSDADKMILADFVITNVNIEETKKHIAELHKQLVNMPAF